MNDLKNSALSAFVATAKPTAARDFYENTLGLKFVSDEDHALAGQGLPGSRTRTEIYSHSINTETFVLNLRYKHI